MMLHHRHCHVSTMNAIKLFSWREFDDETHFTSLQCFHVWCVSFRGLLSLFLLLFFGEKRKKTMVDGMRLYGFTHKCQEKREKIENSTKISNKWDNSTSLALMMSLKINFYLEQEKVFFSPLVFCCWRDCRSLASHQWRWFGWKVKTISHITKSLSFPLFEDESLGWKMPVHISIACMSRPKYVYTTEYIRVMLWGDGNDDDDIEKRTFLLLFICLIIFQSFLLYQRVLFSDRGK